MKLLIARHGKNKKEFNAMGFPQMLGGSYKYNRGLTEDGIDEVKKKLLKRLLDKKIDAVYSSDLIRAIQTAEIAVSGLELKINRDKRLNEMHFGDLSGEYCDEAVLREDVISILDQKKIEDHLGIPNKFKSFRDYLQHVIYEVDAPNEEATNIITINSELSSLGVESVAEACSRLNGFEVYLVKEHDKNSTIAVFSHGDLIKCWLHKVVTEPQKYSPSTMEMAENIPNKGVYREVSNCSLYEIVLV